MLFRCDFCNHIASILRSGLETGMPALLSRLLQFVSYSSSEPARNLDPILFSPNHSFAANSPSFSSCLPHCVLPLVLPLLCSICIHTNLSLQSSNDQKLPAHAKMLEIRYPQECFMHCFCLECWLCCFVRHSSRGADTATRESTAYIASA